MENNMIEEIQWLANKKITKLAAAGVALAALTFKSADEVSTGEAGIVTTFGKIDRVTTSGLAFHWPWQSVTRIDLKSHTVDIPLEVYSKDSQLAPNNVLSVTFSLPEADVANVYAQYGANYFDSVLKNPIENIFREAFGTRTADQIIADRISLNNDVSERLKDEFKTRGVLFERLSISIRFNDAFNLSAEKSAIARTEVNTASQLLDRTKIEANTAIALAKGQADADFEKKTKEAQGILAIGKAQVEVLELKAKMAAGSPALTGLITAEKWDGKLPSTMIPGGAIPMLNLDPKQGVPKEN